MSQNDSPTREEKAKFYLQRSIDTIGYRETIENALGEGHHATTPNDDPDQFIENLERSFHEGVSHYMQNKREHGSHPENAFLQVVDDAWPDWVLEQIAQSEHDVFAGGTEWSDEEEEYLEFLENRFDVPL